MISVLVLLAAKDEGLLDRLGLESLDEIPWEVFPVALLLSAVVGAAGGLIYAGLLGSDDSGKKKEP